MTKNRRFPLLTNHEGSSFVIHGFLQVGKDKKIRIEGKPHIQFYQYRPWLFSISNFKKMYLLNNLTTERPAILSFRALTASIYMLEFILANKNSIRELCSSEYFSKRFNSIKGDVERGLNIFKNVNGHLVFS